MASINETQFSARQTNVKGQSGNLDPFFIVPQFTTRRYDN